MTIEMGQSPKSDRSSQRTLVSEAERNHVSEDDPRHLFKAFIADINFRSASESSPISSNHRKSVYELIDRGPHALMGGNSPELRWIHLPANNMAWIEDLMKALNEEQLSQSPGKSSESQESTKFEGVLREDLWRRAYHGRHKAGIHSRFMMPFATRYSSSDPESPDSDDSDTKMQNANVTALYLPYLHWESYNSWKDRQKHIKDLKELAPRSKRCDCLSNDEGTIDHIAKRSKSLLHRYLYHDAPLHDRRTLDQSYFYNLRNVEHHDEDQVVGIHTWNKAEQNNHGRKMMMTDQLWMWVIDGKTVITSFPETGSGGNDEADVLYRLQENLSRGVQQGDVKSMHSLMAFIIDHCTGVFQRSDINPDLAFFEFFADEIGAARSEVDVMFRDFRKLSQVVEGLWTQDITPRQLSRELDHLFSIKHEIKLMEWVEKILSDLSKIDFVCKQQEEVLHSLLKCCKNNRSSSRSLADLCETVAYRRNAWAAMAVTAQAAHDNLQGLLDLKQRQAAVSEARTVRYQVEMTARQGQSIMLLTVFTTFLLPVSVMATIFGMNAIELVGKDGGRVTIWTMAAFIVPVTVTLVLGAFSLAFYEQTKNLARRTVRAVVRTVVDVGFRAPRRGDTGV